jgi:hypothetical protein
MTESYRDTARPRRKKLSAINEVIGKKRRDWEYLEFYW